MVVDRLADRGRRRDAAGADRPAVDVQRAGAALPDAAAELGAGQPDVIADHPEQRRLRVGIDGMHGSVDGQIERHTRVPPAGGIVVDGPQSRQRGTQSTQSPTNSHLARVSALISSVRTTGVQVPRRSGRARRQDR